MSERSGGAPGGLVAADREDVLQRVHAWGRTALIAGVVAAAGLFLQSLLFILDATGILPRAPEFQETGNGFDKDLATYYAAFFEHQHDIAWNIAIRDTLGPVASIAMIVLALALTRVRGDGRPRLEVWTTVFAVGALLRLISDLVYLSQLGVWRFTGFGTDLPADIIAAGRTSDAIGNLTDYLELAAIVILAVALVGVAALLSRRLRLLALVLAATLLVSAVAMVAFWDVVFDVTAILTGLVLGPVLLVSLGRWLAQSVDRPA
jgi:hypothetical protein